MAWWNKQRFAVGVDDDTQIVDRRDRCFYIFAFDTRLEAMEVAERMNEDEEFRNKMLSDDPPVHTVILRQVGRGSENVFKMVSFEFIDILVQNLCNFEWIKFKTLKPKATGYYSISEDR